MSKDAVGDGDPYMQAMRQAVFDLRATSERLLKIAKFGYMAGAYRRFFDSSPVFVGVAVLPAAVRGCVQDGNVSTLGRIAAMLAEDANTIEQSIAQGWNGRSMPDAEADLDG
jgi:hypothetical protein